MIDRQLLEDLRICGESVSYWLEQENKEYTQRCINDMRELLDRAEKEIRNNSNIKRKEI